MSDREFVFEDDEGKQPLTPGVTMHFETVDLYPLPPAMSVLREKVFDFLDEDQDPEEAIAEEIERLFGPEPDALWPERLAGLVRLLKVTEQAAVNEESLAQPHYQAALRHSERAARYKRAVEAYKDALRGKLQEVGGRFSDGEIRMHIRSTERLEVIGTCEAHSGDHFESGECLEFQPSRSMPPAFLRVKYEPKRRELATYVKTEHPETKACSFARIVPGKPALVIR
jgi:hypothetical protein